MMTKCNIWNVGMILYNYRLISHQSWFTDNNKCLTSITEVDNRENQGLKMWGKGDAFFQSL